MKLYESFTRYFESSYNDLRYAQMANRFDDFEKIIVNGLNDIRKVLENPKGLDLPIEKVEHVKSTCEAFLERKKNLDRFISNTK